ncbi:ABC transporter permease [Tautonia plasticadhaerens]|uniref:Ribose transport system permease protein RbsC n=1 Tax=Tautonia plasticadhaerens TaxID=2527974 RepID=A0A518GYZ8_9BACT|nr:ABC transporter permease [Tautonia plasticadhaerens]QDV33797.1 Ribose transport system permease protein RbsC [Tautonia plasticadhaerens]
MSDEPKPSSPASGPGIGAWLRGSEAGLAVAIVAVVGLIYVVAPGPSAIFEPGAPRPFFSGYNLQTLLHLMALYGVLSVGVAVVIIAGGIDLSIGSMVALSAVVSARLMTSWLPGIGEAGAWTTGLLVIAAVTLLGWVGLNLLGAPWARGLIYGSIPAALIAAGVGLANGPMDAGSWVVAGLEASALILLVFGLRRGSDDRAGATPAALVWGLAAGLLAGWGTGGSGAVATGALVVSASALALLIGLVLHLRKAGVGLAVLVGAAVVWGVTSAGGGSSSEVPIGVIVASVTLSLLLGLAIGSGHAFLINEFRLPPFIATLATLAGLRSLAIILSDNRSITVSDRTFRVVGSEYWVTIPLFLAVALILSLMMGTTVLGRHLFALGGNEAAARLSGLPTRRLKTVAYAISGLLAALGGVLFFGNSGSATPTMGFAYELSAITAAVVGGCSLAGGVGSIRGTVLGLILIRIVINGTGLVVEGIDPSQIEGLVLGVVVVLAVGFNQRFRLQR